MTTLPTELRADWHHLLRPTEPLRAFDPGEVDDLPAPAARWLRHAIAPGTPLRARAHLSQTGQLRLRGRWWPFVAEQALDPLAGVVWPVTVRMLGVAVHGYDRLVVRPDGPDGEMRHRALGRFTVVHAHGEDYLRSASARPAAELMWCPAAALDPRVRWRPVDDHRAVAIVPVGGVDHEVTITVDGGGAVREVSMARWADDGEGTWGWRTFGGHVEDEATFGGFTIPSRTVAGYGDDPAGAGAFIRQTIEHATFL